MKTQPGTVQHYNPYVIGLLKQLDCEDNLGDTVWHYTSGDALIKILESGKIFATQVSCLNDATEVRYSASVLRKALVELPGLSDSDRGSMFIKQFISFLQDDDKLPNHMGLPYFVCCFSSLEDDLSQWRAYDGYTAPGNKEDGGFGRHRSAELGQQCLRHILTFNPDSAVLDQVELDSVHLGHVEQRCDYHNRVAFKFFEGLHGRYGMRPLAATKGVSNR